MAIKGGAKFDLVEGALVLRNGVDMYIAKHTVTTIDTSR